MNKEISIKIDYKLFEKLNNNELSSKDIVSKALHQFFENEKQDKEIVTTLTQNVKELEKQKELLEIDYACLRGENKIMQTRIDDLARLYPSAVTLLGKTSEFQSSKRKMKFFKK
ncbi:MAG: hypothetical protein R6V50_05365 [Thermoplasmatota archaeon]